MYLSPSRFELTNSRHWNVLALVCLEGGAAEPRFAPALQMHIVADLVLVGGIVMLAQLPRQDCADNGSGAIANGTGRSDEEKHSCNCAREFTHRPLGHVMSPRRFRVALPIGRAPTGIAEFFFQSHLAV